MSAEQLVCYAIAWSKPKGTTIVAAKNNDGHIQYVEFLK